MAEPDPGDPGPLNPAAARRAAPSPLPWVLAAVFAVTTVLLAVVAVGLKGDRDSFEDDRQDVELVAGRFAQALVEFRTDAVLADSAGAFRDQFEDAMAQLAEVNTALEREATSTITEIFVPIVEGSEVTVIVVYDSVETVAGADPVTLRNIYLRLGMVKLDGAWKVQDVINLNTALSSVGQGDGTGGDPTATTAPAG